MAGREGPGQGLCILGTGGQVFEVPHSTLPGFMRPRGSSVSLSCRIVSTPTEPTSSCSSRRLPIPMPCSPVHVPWRARARLGGQLKEFLSGSSLPLPSPTPTFPWLSPYLPRFSAKALTFLCSSTSSGLTSMMQWKLPSPTCPTMAPGNPENKADHLWPPCSGHGQSQCLPDSKYIERNL